MLKKLSVFIFIVSLIILSDMRVQAASSPVFGPKKYTREKGAPDEMKESISVCAASGEYRLVVENGTYLVMETGDKKNKTEKKTKISAAEIKIDGNELIREDDLKKKVARFEKIVTLSAGTHTMQVELEGKPGAFITVTLECVSGCVEAKITVPYAGTVITNTKALVTGYILNADGEVGVALTTAMTGAGGGEESALAQVYGSGFAGSAPLASGANTITATVTDTCGLKAEDKVVVDVVSGPYVDVSASPANGTPSQSGTFETTLRADARINAAVADYSWDTDGDGTIDVSGKDSSSVTISYTSAGLYYPKVIVTDTAGNQYSDTAVVNVISMAEADELLRAKWDGMKAGLVAGDVEKALRYFSERSQDMYRYNFTLMSNILPQMANDMGSITFVKMSGDMAEYNMTAIQDGNTHSFYVVFVRDKDGIWRIKFY